MNRDRRALKNRLFLAAFLVLTFFCWCPLGYGEYGEVSRMFGMPNWVVRAFAFGAGLFILEWFYLFRSGLALNDEDLTRTVAELEAAGREAG